MFHFPWAETFPPNFSSHVHYLLTSFAPCVFLCTCPHFLPLFYPFQPLRRARGRRVSVEDMLALSSLVSEGGGAASPHNFARLLSQLRDMCAADRALLYTVDPATHELVGTGNVRVPIGRGLPGSCAATGETVLCAGKPCSRFLSLCTFFTMHSSSFCLWNVHLDCPLCMLPSAILVLVCSRCSQ